MRVAMIVFNFEFPWNLMFSFGGSVKPCIVTLNFYNVLTKSCSILAMLAEQQLAMAMGYYS